MALVSKNFSDIITFTRASSATYFDSAGVLQTATTDAPRFDYDPSTLAAQGLLIEEARTNISPYSEDFSDPSWSKTNSTITSNATIAPNGTLTADKHIPDLGATIGTGATQTRLAQGNYSRTAGVSYTVTIFAKQDEFNSLRIADIETSNDKTFDYNLSTGVASVIAGSSATASMKAIGNGWYRCIATWTQGTTESKQTRFTAFDTVVTTGDGTSGVYIWGAQLEAGAFPTSYIPTTSTAVTRAADQAIVNTLSPWYNAAEGTLYCEHQVIGGGPASFVARLSSAASTEYMALGYTGSSLVPAAASYIRNGASAQISTTFSTKPAGVNKELFKYSASSFKDVTNATVGNNIVPSSGVPTPTSLQWNVTATSTTAAPVIQGATYIRRLTYYPRSLSDAEAQAITT